MILGIVKLLPLLSTLPWPPQLPLNTQEGGRLPLKSWGQLLIWLSILRCPWSWVPGKNGSGVMSSIPFTPSKSHMKVLLLKKKYFIKTHTLVEFKNQRRDCSICPLLWPALCEVCFSLNKSTPYLKKQNKTKTKGGLPWCLSGKESTCQCRKYGLHPWSGRIPHPAEQLSPCPTTVEPVL